MRIHNTLSVAKRLILKPVEPEDIVHIERWAYSDDYAYFFRDLPMMTRAQIQTYANFQDGRAFMVWRQPAEGAPNPAGLVCLHDMRPVPSTVKVGVLIDRTCQESGYALEAVKQVVEFAFFQMHFNKIIAEIIEANHRTVELLEKGGFRREARLEKESNYKGVLTDVLRYVLFRDEYRQKVKEGFYGT